MWLLFSSPADTAARWARLGLLERGLDPLIWIPGEALSRARRWIHRIGRNGVSLELVLDSGLTLHDEEVKGVLNRMPWPPDHSLWMAPEDREYVRQEMSAFYLSWLYGLSAPVLNRPHPQGLAGAFRPPAVWHHLATRAGLETVPYRAGSHHPGPGAWQPAWNSGALLFVVGEETIPAAGVPPPPKPVRQAAVRLGKLSNTPLLALRFITGSGGGWRFIGADTLPDLSLGGAPLLDALTRCLTRNGRGRG